MQTKTVNPKNRERRAKTELTTTHARHPQWTTPDIEKGKHWGTNT